MRKAAFVRSGLTVSALAMVMAGSAAAQTAEADGGNGEVDASDIVVTGFRKSSDDAINAKRDEIEITDGISSDDLGRIPDLNIGEALQRIPGIQLNREAEGREATINFRGLPGEYLVHEIRGL